MTLRQRLLLTLTPSLLLLALVGGAGIVLLDQVSRRINLILRENYDSVVAMVGLNEALERIDSAFTVALLGREQEAREQYQRHWPIFDEYLRAELDNITILPREAELASILTTRSQMYRAAGDRFWKMRSGKEREASYLGSPGGLLEQFRTIKQVTEEIRLLNQHHMEEASSQARQTAHDALVGFAAGLGIAVALAVWLIIRTVRAILAPLAEVTRSVRAMGAGDLDQMVPVESADELGQLAESFNRMARQMRDYRRGHLAQLLRAQRTSQAAIDSFPDPVFVVDPAGEVEMANPAASKLLGVTVSGPDAPRWSPPPALTDPIRLALTQQQAHRTQTFDQALTFQMFGEERAYLPQVLPINDPYGGTLGAAILLEDVTRFRLLDQLKGDLVATVSHELKTPLTSVRLVLHLLLEETVGPLTTRQTELLVDARENAERLLAMIEQLLALARLEQASEAWHFASSSLVDVVQAALETARPRLADRHLDLIEELACDLPEVPLDRVRFLQVLGNLFNNAIAYTPEGGKITVRARAVPHAVRLEIEDTGPGIPEEHLPHIFDRFFRVPGTSSPQGTGLGLAIVQKIVQGHGGRIWCERSPSQGARFIIELPLVSGEELHATS